MTSYKMFQKLCLDKDVLELNSTARCDICADIHGEEICSMASQKAMLSTRHLEKRLKRTQFLLVNNISSLRH